MSLSAIEIEMLHHLYLNADKGERTAFIDWAAGETGPFMPEKLRSVEEYLRATTRMIECPHCGSTRIVRNGSHGGKQRYLCKDCKRTSGHSNGFPMYHSRKPYLVWRKFIRCCEAKKSLRYIVKSCGISMPTAILWRRKYIGGIKRLLRNFVSRVDSRGMFVKGTDVNGFYDLIEEKVTEHYKVRYMRRPKLPFGLTYPDPPIFRP